MSFPSHPASLVLDSGKVTLTVIVAGRVVQLVLVAGRHVPGQPTKATATMTSDGFPVEPRELADPAVAGAMLDTLFRLVNAGTVIA